MLSASIGHSASKSERVFQCDIPRFGRCCIAWYEPGQVQLASVSVLPSYETGTKNQAVTGVTGSDAREGSVKGPRPGCRVLGGESRAADWDEEVGGGRGMCKAARESDIYDAVMRVTGVSA